MVADSRRRMGQARHARRDCRFGYALHCSRNGRMVQEEACHTSIGAPDPLSLVPQEAWGCFSPRVQKQGCRDVWTLHLAGRSFVSAPPIGEAETSRNLLDLVDFLNTQGWSLPQAAGADAFRHYQRFLALTVGHAGAPPKRH